MDATVTAPRKYTHVSPQIEELVFSGLGAASVCWENMSGTGVFNSTRAKQIGEEICQKLDWFIETNYKSRGLES